MRADYYGLEIQDEGFLTNPGEVSNHEFPRKVNIHARLDDDALAHAGAEAAENPAFEPGRKRPTRKEENALHRMPERLDP